MFKLLRFALYLLGSFGVAVAATNELCTQGLMEDYPQYDRKVVREANWKFCLRILKGEYRDLSFSRDQYKAFEKVLDEVQSKQ